MKISLLSKLSKGNARYLLFIFFIAIVVRAIPEIIAYPFPIGYDVINYYIPVIANFEGHWATVSNQFPLYVSILYILTIATNLDPFTVVRISAITIFGFFTISIYTISRRVIGLQKACSLFLALFVMFQTSVLRTSWDLHKDMISLSLMFFAFSLITMSHSISKKTFLTVLFLCVISVLTDRMIGLLLTATLIIYALIKRDKQRAVLSIIIFLVLLTAYLQSANEIKANVGILDGPFITNNVYSPTNLATLFLITNIFLIPTGIIGFLRIPEALLKIPIILSLVASLSWVVYSFSSSLLPDRWTFTFSILLSLFSGYGFIVLIERMNRFYAINKVITSLVIIVPFVIIGILYSTMSNDLSYTLLAPFHEYIGQFAPMTMQYNSISIPESRSIVTAIDWINQNTPTGSTIIIDKNWRGWAELGLKQRNFQFYDDKTNFLGLYGNYYLLEFSYKVAPNNVGEIQRIYKNHDFTLYNIAY